ncbi:MAG: hypothetical protein ACR2HF_06700 [Methylococcaceae bacterium]
MRISEEQAHTIKSIVQNVFGESTKLKLFGSRTLDHAKGGDIDLFIQTDQIVEQPARLLSQIEAKIIMQLGERKVDIILDAPNIEKTPVSEIAERTGVAL